MEHPFGPFTVPDIRDFVPEKLKPWILVFFVLVFQLSGGVYLAAVSEMTGSTALMQEDIMMAGYASLIGLSLNFALMFRLKFRFSIKTSLITCAAVIILCNIICVTTHSVPLLVTACLIAGFFRMWGTFACNTTIQLWVTPTRDFAVWFCYIYLIVANCIQLGGLTTGYISFFTRWEYMHYFIIGMLLLVILITYIVFRHYHGMPKLPLWGIDWLGCIMWAVIALCITFVCVYGEHYEWYESWQIRFASVVGVITLILNLWRASFIRHPFLCYDVMTHPQIIKIVLVYFAMYLLLGTEHSIEHIYTEMILGYDNIHAISLNWFVVVGILAGCAFTYITFALNHWRYKTMVILGFVSIFLYLLTMYLNADFNLSYEALVLPMFLRGFGSVILEIVLLTGIAQAGLPFPIFPQGLLINGLFSAVICGVFGATVVERVFRVMLKSNILHFGSTLDNVNPDAVNMPISELSWMLQSHATMVTIKELYGLLCIVAALFIIAFLLMRSTLRPSVFHPKWSTVRKLFKRSIG